jgi:hypothetical protein
MTASLKSATLWGGVEGGKSSWIAVSRAPTPLSILEAVSAVIHPLRTPASLLVR